MEKRVWISSKMGPSTKKGSSIRIRCRVSAILFSISCSFCMYCVQNTCQITHASAKNQIIWMLQQQPKQKQAENIHTEQSIIQMRICFSWRYPISGNLVGKRASKQVTNNALLPHFHEFISTYNFFSVGSFYSEARSQIRYMKGGEISLFFVTSAVQSISCMMYVYWFKSPSPPVSCIKSRVLDKMKLSIYWWISHPFDKCEWQNIPCTRLFSGFLIHSTSAPLLNEAQFSVLHAFTPPFRSLYITRQNNMN